MNTNAIPFAAIQQVEILRDGASSIYGSDAMVVVVNTILRKDYTGTEVRLRMLFELYLQQCQRAIEHHQCSFGDLLPGRSAAGSSRESGIPI
jgi:outer membrane receptor for ferrienterochelin and colicin